MEKRDYFIILYDFYSSLFSEKQKEYLQHLIALIETRPDFWGFARKEEN